MDEKELETKVNQIAHNITEDKCFNLNEQKTLSDLLAKEGHSDAFFQKAQEMFKEAFERVVQRTKLVATNFDEQVEAVAQKMEEEKLALSEKLSNKLSQLADDDFAAKSELFEEYNQMVLSQYGELEQRIKELGAKAMIDAL